MMMLMVVMIVILVGDEGEERLHQVKGVNPTQYHQHLVDVVRGFSHVVVVWMVVASTSVNVQT